MVSLLSVANLPADHPDRAFLEKLAREELDKRFIAQLTPKRIAELKLAYANDPDGFGREYRGGKT
jgi:hypothetical protein